MIEAIIRWSVSNRFLVVLLSVNTGEVFIYDFTKMHMDQWVTLSNNTVTRLGLRFLDEAGDATSLGGAQATLTFEVWDGDT